MHACPDVMKLMYPNLDDELDATGMFRVQTHLQECPRCSDAFESEHTFLELVKSQMAPIPARTEVCN